MESIKNLPLSAKIILGFLAIGFCYGFISELIGYDPEANNKQTNNQKTEQKESKKLKCKDDWTYMTEYENVFDDLYPYGHSVSGLDWKDVRTTDSECQYHTIIKIKDENKNKTSHDLYINTTLDQDAKKEHVKSLMVDNVIVYEQ